MPSIDKVRLKILKSRAKVGISSIQKNRDSRDVLIVFRLRKRYKQTKFSVNNNTTLPWIGNTTINVHKKKKGVTTEVKIYYKLLHRG